MENKKILASVIVCRKGSVRIPDKMNQKIGKYTMLENKIRQLINVKRIDKIFVGTDDDTIRETVEKYGATFIRRPDECCDETKASANDMIRNMLGYIDADVILWNHITNPLCGSKEYSKAIEMYFDNLPQHDSVFGATKLQSHFWFRGYNPINTPGIVPLNFDPNPEVHRCAGALEPVYSQNGSIFIRDYGSMIRDGNFLGHSPKLFEMDEIHGWDVNNPWELEVAKCLYDGGEKYNIL